MPAVLDLDSLPEPGSRGFELNGERFFAVRHDGRVFAYRNSCPHLGVELEWEEDRFLDHEGVLIQCAMHGALFVIESGICVSGPCLGLALEPVPCRIRDGQLWVELPD